MQKEEEVYGNVVEMNQMIIQQILNHLNLNQNLQIIPAMQVLQMYR